MRNEKTETRGDVFPYCTGNKHFDKLGEKDQKHKETHGNRKHEVGGVGAVGCVDISKNKKKVFILQRALFFLSFELLLCQRGKVDPK